MEAGLEDRIAAVRILARWLARGISPERTIHRRQQVSAFLNELVSGVVRWKLLLEWICQHYLSRSPSPALQACLLSGTYQLWFMDSVPDYAAVHTTTEVARFFAGEGGAALVNAILRNIQRNRQKLLSELDQAPLHVRKSHPLTLWQRWEAHWGTQKAVALADWNNQRPELVIRIRTAVISTEAYRNELAVSGIETQPHPAAPDQFLVIKNRGRVAELPGYEQGFFVVQDPATRLAVDLLHLKPGLRVLDGCAAPGGKTIMTADRMGPEAEIVAVDRSRHRLALLRENLSRCGISTVRCLQLDLSSTDAAAQLGEHSFDRILLDVPCTNTGVIRRHSDIKWSWSEERLHRTIQLQRRLLESAVRLLSPQGRLVYSTCSLEPEENSLLIEDWLREHPEFVLEEMIETFPPESGTDGIFAARLGRRASD